ncbi:MAG TPA: 30S ribosomal protein S6 [Dehalococcoidia bacterium]|nr:30S ribosomal protein S6 [Dehalococcoidia bacterium]
MRHYELMIILSPMLSQQEAGEVWTRVKEFITNHQGQITHDQRMGTRRLAYPIRKSAHHFLEGNYHLARFSTETAFTRELETFLRLDERIIRYLTVTTGVPKATPEPAPAPAAGLGAEREEAPAREPVAVAAGTGGEPEAAAPAAQPASAEALLEEGAAPA